MSLTLVGLQDLWAQWLTQQNGIEYQFPGTYAQQVPPPASVTDTPDFWNVMVADIVPANDISVLADNHAAWMFMNLGTCAAKWQTANRFTGWIDTGTPPTTVGTAQNNPYAYSNFGSPTSATLGFNGNAVTMPFNGVKTWDWTGYLYVVCMPIALDIYVPMLRQGALIQSILTSTSDTFQGVASDMGWWVTGPPIGVTWQPSIAIKLS
jgi:hypothetical protein